MKKLSGRSKFFIIWVLGIAVGSQIALKTIAGVIFSVLFGGFLVFISAMAGLFFMSVVETVKNTSSDKNLEKNLPLDLELENFQEEDSSQFSDYFFFTGLAFAILFFWIAYQLRIHW